MTSALTWLAIKSWSKYVWTWIKTHWKIALTAMIILAVIVVSRARARELMKVISHLRESHKKESEGMKLSYEEEKQKIKEAHENMRIALKEVEKKYQEDSRKLDSAKKKEIQEIIKRNASNPDEITRRIAELTGFTIYVKG